MDVSIKHHIKQEKQIVKDILQWLWLLLVDYQQKLDHYLHNYDTSKQERLIKISFITGMCFYWKLSASIGVDASCFF